MTAISVYVCPGANQAVDPVSGAGECTSGAGSWQSVELAVPFDPSQLNFDDLAGAFGAGFFVLGSLVLIAGAARSVFEAIRLGK